jgi:hypothetical protein
MLCSRAQNLISAYCDREITGAEMLQVRSHLDRCAECRKEYEATLQVKRLFGGLGAAAPPRAFDPSILDRPSPTQRAWSSFLRNALGQMRALTAYAGLSRGSLEQSLQSLRSAPSSLALSGLLAVSLVTVALLRTPQHADAVSAHVPAHVGSDEGMVVFLPPDGMSAPRGVEALPDEVREVQASQVLGAEAPIRPSAYTASFNGPPVGFIEYGGPSASFYPQQYPHVEPVAFIAGGRGYR